MIISRHSIKILCAFIGLGWVMPAVGQLKYDALTTSHGLSQGYIYDILQDRDGFMWFGTKDGLNRYDGYSFKVYTYDSYNPNSISNNNINRLFEDSKGRLWVSTDDGINIYDKKRDRFRRILHNPKDANSLSGNTSFLPVIEMPDGRFLIFPQEKSINVISLPADFLENNSQPTITRLSAPGAYNVSCMYMDGNKKIWILSDNLYELQPNDLSLLWRRHRFEFGQTALAADGSVWADDLFFSQVQDTNAYPLFSKDITKGHGRTFLHELDKKRFWLGITDSGRLEVYDINNWKRGSPVDPDQTRLHGFSGITPTKIFKDRSGLVWLGTNGYGLRKYSNDTEKFHHIASGLSVRKIMGLPNNQVFLRGWGELKKFDAEGNNLTGKVEKALFGGHDFFMGKAFTIWGLRRKPNSRADNYDEVIEKINLVTKSSTSYKINVSREEELTEPIMEDSNGNIWLAGLGGRLVVLNPFTGTNKKFSFNTDAARPMLKGAQITTLYEDALGVFWAGTETGLAKINFQFGTATPPKITWYKTNTADKTALNYSHVLCIINDALDSNLMWVATKGGGLNRLNKTTQQFTHITTKEGLCNNVVYGLLQDGAGNIWGSTNNGIFCLLKERQDQQGKWLFRHFTKVSGLQDDEFNTGAYAQLSNGDLAFGGVNGVNIFNPATVLQSGFTPKVFITKILSGNELVLPNDKTGILKQAIEQAGSITLNHLQDILTLEFSSLDFTAPGQNKYRYQLVGVDKDWIESGTRRSATYLHLPPGKYIFKVQGSNSQGVWSSAIAALNIVVNPPWWRTWWAYLLYACLIGFAGRTYFLFRIKKAKLQSQLHFEQQEAKRVKELDTLKTQLYANITHEFRTPLTVIMGMAQQVKSNPDEHLDTGMDMIVRNGSHLLNLVNEMLDLSKLEDGKMTLHLVNGDVINFLRYIVESFQSLAAGQQKQFHFLSDTDELAVAYDAEKLRQIISNLLSNALKFTPAHGNVYVSISQEATSKADHTILVLKVKDTGIGIPENQLQHIFDRFYQLDNSHTRKAEGTGIGLALTKELVKLMSGTISVKSPAVGATKGSEFTITLPLQKVKLEQVSTPIPVFKKEAERLTVSEPKEPVVAYNEHATAATPLVLLVEDNADVVAYTASCLPDYKLAVGKDGKEGLEIATDMIPDIIISDVMMPFVDGFEMCQKLKQDERTSHIPIIMLTAKADMQSKLEGLEKGADVYLEKPFHKEELLLRIKKLLELRKTLQQYYSKQIGIATDTEIVHAQDALKTTIEEPIEHEFVQKVRELVEANFTNYEFTVEKLCKLIFMSHSQLHRKLEALTGCSPNKFIRIIRLNKAKELLRNPSLSIATIALDCGYNDPGYFARVFKQEYGVTPQDWRLTMQK